MKFDLIATFCSLALVTFAKAQLPNSSPTIINTHTTTTGGPIITVLAVPTSDITITPGPVDPIKTTTTVPFVPPEPTVTSESASPTNVTESAVPTNVTESAVPTYASESAVPTYATESVIPAISIPPSPDTSADYGYPTLSSGSPASATPSQTPSPSISTSDAGNLRSSIFGLGITLIVGMLLF